MSKPVIPSSVLSLLENKLSRLTHGSVTLEIKKHDNRCCKFDITEKITIVPDTPMSGSVHGKENTQQGSGG